MTTDLRTDPLPPPPPPPPGLTTPGAGTPPGGRPPPPVGDAVRTALLYTFGLLAIAGGVVLAFFLLDSSVTRIEQTETTHPALERVVLDLRANGGVRIEAHDAEEIVVHQRIETTFRTIEVDQRVVGDELHLTSARCPSRVVGLFNRCNVSYVVRVPASTSVAGELSHGSIELAGLDGTAQLRTGHGRIEASDVAGTLDVSSGHGSIEVIRATGDVVVNTRHGSLRLFEVAGGAEATTGHGSVEVAEVGGPLVVRTGHGGIDVLGTTGDLVILESGHGGIDLVAAVAPSTIGLRTSHGRVEVTLPADAPPYAIDTDASGGSVHVGVSSDPNAPNRLEASTGHGRIELRLAVD